MPSSAGGLEARIGDAVLGLYRFAGRIGEPIVERVLERRQRRGKEDPLRVGERLGRTAVDRPEGPLVWVHAASVGETNSVLPLIHRLGAMNLPVLLTTGTVTSAEVAGRRLPDSAIHQFGPVDTPQTIRRFLDHWRPDLALFAESEIWPAAIAALDEARTPLVLVNARMSERSFRTWCRIRPLAKAVFRRFGACFAQTLDDARRFEALGVGRVRTCGNLKFDAPAPPADNGELQRLRFDLGGRPVFLAASTHPGEDESVIAAHLSLRNEFPGLLTIIVPRHPERGTEIAALLADAGVRHSLRSQGGRLTAVEAYVADTIGEMGLWYRMADVAFLGGSLVPHGGQNPIEPAKLDTPVLHGPDVGNFRDVYAALQAAGAVRAIDRETLATTVAALLADRTERQRLAREAHACVGRFTGALDRTMDALSDRLRALSAAA